MGEKNVYSQYQGKGGVPLSFLRKVLFAIRFGALNILLSDELTGDSRIMYYRKIQDRVLQGSPFIHLDPDSYLVISTEGRLLWILDGYTTTNRFPYSEPVGNLGNYIRNSVKAVVDAYDGTLSLYIADPKDPIIQTYAQMFPGVLKPLEQMPAELRKPSAIPRPSSPSRRECSAPTTCRTPRSSTIRKTSGTSRGRPRRLRPRSMKSSLITPSCGCRTSRRRSSVVLLPFTPSKKDNMSAWMAARCDAPHYGEVIVYNFPKQKMVYGPRQIEARIDQEAEISKQLSLWNQRGSSAIRGDLLAIPIEKSILYVEPLYLSADKSQLPELKRVIVAFGNSLAMEENLELALQKLFGGEVMKEKAAVAKASAAAPAEKGRTGPDVAGEALGHYRKAQEFLRQGNWAGFGDELRKVEEALRKMEERK